MFQAKRLTASADSPGIEAMTPSSSMHRFNHRLDAYQTLQQLMGSHLCVEVGSIKARDLSRAYAVLQHRNPFIASFEAPGQIEYSETLFRPQGLARFKTIEAFMTAVNLRCRGDGRRRSSALYFCQKGQSTLISLAVSHSLADLQTLMALMEDLLQIAKYGGPTESRELECLSDCLDFDINGSKTSLKHLHAGVCRVNLPYSARETQAFQVKVDRLSRRDSADLLAFCKKNRFSMQMLTEILHYLVKIELFEHTPATAIGLMHAFTYAQKQGNCARVEPVIVQSDLQALRADWMGELRRITDFVRAERANPHNQTVEAIRNCMYTGEYFDMALYQDDYSSSVPGFGKMEQMLLGVGISMQLCYEAPESEDKLYVCGLNGQLQIIHNFLNSMDESAQHRIVKGYRNALEMVAAAGRQGDSVDLFALIAKACSSE